MDARRIDGRPGCSLAALSTTKERRMGQSRFHPEYTSCMVFPPVMTTLPEKKHSRTTGDASGL